jgi:uncharacterized protein (TIGR02145 family)
MSPKLPLSLSMTPRFHRLGLPLAIAGALASWSLLASCQDSVTIIEETGPTATTSPSNHPAGTFRMSDTVLLPDSIGFHTRLDSGAAPYTRTRLETSTEVSFRPPLSKPLGADSMQVDLYTLGLRTTRLVYKQGDNGDELRLAYSVPTASDSTAGRLLRAFQLVRKLETSTHSRPDSPRDSQIADFRQTIAQLALDGNDAAKGISSKTPRGLDTADLNARVLQLAAKSGLSLGEVVRKWSLSMDIAQAQALSLKLSLDQSTLAPFKMESPLAMDTLHLTETNKSLRGRISGKFGVKSLQVTLVDSADKPASSLEATGIPDLSTSPREVSFTGQVAVVASSGAKLGKYTLVAKVQDSLDNAGTFRLGIVVSDVPDREGPQVEFVDPAAATSGRKLLSFSDSVLKIKVRVEDRSGLKFVKIQGKPADSLDKGLWGASIHPALGDDSIVVETQDGLANERRSSLPLHRCQKMSIKLLAPSGDTEVSNKVTSFLVAWSVQKAIAVRIGNNLSSSSSDRHEASVTLAEGANRIFLAGVDSAGKPDTNFVSINRRFLTPLNISFGVDTGVTLPDSAVVVAQSDAGAKFWWSIGGTSWTEFAGRMTWRTNGALQIRAVLAGKDTNIKTLPTRQFYHVNHAPTVAVVKNSIVVKSYLGSLAVSGAVKVLDWGLGDGVQSGSWEVQFQDPSVNQFLAKVSTDAQGNIGGLILQDTSVTLKFRMRVNDDGGTSNGGVVLSAWTDWMNLLIVDTVQDVDHNAYRTIRMPDGKVWMRSNLRTLPETQFDPDTSCPSRGCEAGRVYSQIQAFTYSAAMNNALYLAPSKGICPSGWHISSRSEWSALFKATIPTGEADSLYALRLDSTWSRRGKQSPETKLAGGGSFGDFILPSGAPPMASDELWLWMPKDGSSTVTGPWIFALGNGINVSSRAGIRCVMD